MSIHAMTTNGSAREYVERLLTHLRCCASIEPEQRTSLPHRFDEKGNAWIVVRGFDAFKELFQDDSEVANPFELIHGGQLRLQVRVRELARTGKRLTEITAYCLSILDLSSNPNNVQCLRFDKPEGQPRGDGWEQELGDNPRHPWAHLHVNFVAGIAANDCRLPTGPLCPILLLRAFDYWYCSTFEKKR